jgi:hypothetical protein
MSEVLSAKIDALGRFLLATHQHEARPECSPCLELRAALGLEPAS